MGYYNGMARPFGLLDRLIVRELAALTFATLGFTTLLYLVIDYADRAPMIGRHAFEMAALQFYANKAAVIAYCESLRGELKPAGIHVVTLCPGYIDTPLTQKNGYGMPFLMQPEAFAEKAFMAISAGDSYRVIPWQMGIVAKLLRLLPNSLFDKLLEGRARKPRKTV